MFFFGDDHATSGLIAFAEATTLLGMKGTNLNRVRKVVDSSVTP